MNVNAMNVLRLLPVVTSADSLSSPKTLSASSTRSMATSLPVLLLKRTGLSHLPSFKTQTFNLCSSLKRSSLCSTHQKSLLPSRGPLKRTPSPTSGLCSNSTLMLLLSRGPPGGKKQTLKKPSLLNFLDIECIFFCENKKIFGKKKKKKKKKK